MSVGKRWGSSKVALSSNEKGTCSPRYLACIFMRTISTLRSRTDKTFEEVIFLSRHRAASGIPTLTVHPIGNYGKADHGGAAGHLVPSAPRTMTGLLRQLNARVNTLPFKVSFEVTHHGPLMTRPTCFIEIGSSENEWGHEGAAHVIADSILNLEVEDEPIAIGIGGGHYAPRFTELSLLRKIAIGHMVPNYAMESTDIAGIRKMITDAAKASGTDLAYLHSKSLPKARVTSLREMVEQEGLRIIESDDIPPR
jgi:D-aminoacyl-tRNA deacylase